jgi:hypothetical protein
MLSPFCILPYLHAHLRLALKQHHVVNVSVIAPHAQYANIDTQIHFGVMIIFHLKSIMCQVLNMQDPRYHRYIKRLFSRRPQFSFPPPPSPQLLQLCPLV